MKTAVAKPIADGSRTGSLVAAERRKTPRFPCQGTGEVIVLGGALRFTGEVRDLSLSGCCLATNAMFSLERGTQLEILLVVNKVQFRVAGGVRSNHKSEGLGLEFMNVSARCGRLIQNLMEEIELKEHPKLAESRV